MCAAMIACASGCAINDGGVLVAPAKYYANDDGTGRAISIDRWGLQIITYGIDSGMTFGHVHKTYFFAGDASDGPRDRTTRPTNSPGPDETVSFARLHPVGASTAKTWRTTIAVAMMGRSVGAHLLAGPQRIGMSLGWNSQARIVLPREGSRTLLLNASTTRPIETWLLSYHEARRATDNANRESSNP